MQKIGVYDSGIGGLFTLNFLREKFPNYDYVYLSDKKNLPYGEKSKEELTRLATKAIDHLLGLGCGLVVVACNTVCCNVDLKKYGDKIYLITPPLAEFTKKNRCLTLATTMTKNSGIFRGKVVACPELVPLIEMPSPDWQKISRLLEEEYLKNMEEEIIVLGCTHYNYLRDSIKKIYPQKRIISEIDFILDDLGQKLETQSSNFRGGSLLKLEMI